MQVLDQGSQRSLVIRLLIITGAAVVGLVVLGAAAFGVHWAMSGDERAASASVEGFAHAVDRGDQVAVLAMLCSEEADALRESGVPEDETGGGSDLERPIRLSDVEIKGHVARAVVRRPDQEPATVYLKREAEAWKMCDPERLRWVEE
jgi:hypothetical protein